MNFFRLLQQKSELIGGLSMGFAHIMGWLGDVQTMVGLHTTDSFLMEIVKDVISTVVLVSVGYIVTWFFKNILLPDRLKR